LVKFAWALRGCHLEFTLVTKTAKALEIRALKKKAAPVGEQPFFQAGA
jgi:hypothetical protein